MERYSDRAIEIINELHTERLDYESEYLPLIDCANCCKAYEDTGTAPEDIPTGVELANVFCAIDLLKQYQELGTLEEFAAYKNAEEQGHLVRLPCKRGDIVYRICGPKKRRFVAERKVLSVTMYDDERFEIFTTASDWLGKTVFLTREEAEKALKGAKRNG